MEKRPYLGIINHHLTRDRWVGVAGEFAQRNGNSVSTRSCSKVETAFAACSNPDLMTENQLVRHERVRKIVPYVQYGCSCFSYGLLASGRFDFCIDGGFGSYDIFASAAVIKGTGGLVTDWAGNEITLSNSTTVLASGDRKCHEAALLLI